MIPTEILLIISSYLDLQDIFIINDIFKNDHECLAQKLIAWKYPKLFVSLNPIIETFESWDSFISELIVCDSQYKLKRDNRSSFMGIIIRCLLETGALMDSTHLINLRSSICNQFDATFPQLASKNYTTYMKHEIVERIFSQTTLQESVNELIKSNKTFMIRLLTILYRDNIYISQDSFTSELIVGNNAISNVLISDLDLDLIVKLKLQLNVEFGASILEHSIIEKPELIPHFLKYLDKQTFERLILQNQEKYISIENINMEYITSGLLDYILKWKTELFTLITTHPKFQVNKFLLEQACDKRCYRLILILLTHPSYKDE